MAGVDRYFVIPCQKFIPHVEQRCFQKVKSSPHAPRQRHYRRFKIGRF